MSLAALRVPATRVAALSAALTAAAVSTLLFLQFTTAASFDWLDVLRAGLIGLTGFWLAWGAMGGVIGLFYRERVPPRIADDRPIRGRTVILVPIYEEDPIATFSRIAAIDTSLERTGTAARIDIAILSDTRDEEMARREAFWFDRLHAERNGAGRMFYRRRRDNVGRKAGNIADFVQSSGGGYDYALILDADSLMEGETILEMIRRMEADPGLGLLQTLPRIAGARTGFGRTMQFSASLYSPIFARGLAVMQGNAGPFWGHNALVRVRAFAESCHLPPLSGRPPFGGHILSHDYVEAALLVRGGWRVRLDPDLGGSYEGGPENLIAYARRDRRWCQGNLQYVRLLNAPGLTGWSRFVLLQGVLSYVMPCLWFLLLVTTIPAALISGPPDYFQGGQTLFPIFPSDETAKAVGLAIGVVTLLLLPKTMVVLKAISVGAAPQFGGVPRLIASALCEILLTTLIAPMMLMFQVRAVAQIVAGRDGGWPASARSEEEVAPRPALAATWWIVLSGAFALVLTLWLAPDVTLWALPVVVPMMLAPLLVTWTSRPAPAALFAAPEDLETGPVVATARGWQDQWNAPVPEARLA